MNAPTQPSAPSTTEVLAATIAAAVERQLTQYVSAMAQQVEASRRAAEQGKAELRAEFQQQLDELAARLAGEQSARLDELAAKLAGDQSARLAALESTVEQRLMEVPVGSSAFDAEELAMLREQIDSQSAAAHARIDELHKATRRFDEQASALVQHVNDTTIALAQRMDEGNRALATAVEERLALVRTTLEAVGPEVQRQLAEQVTTVNGRLEFIEHRVTDRMLTMEERINEQSGEKIAHLEATIGRIGAGFDDAIGAMSHRLLGVENSLEEALLKIAALQEQIGKVDESAINEVKEQLSTTIGEAMLVRIEIDRLAATTNEKLDKSALRMAEIEAQLADEMDVTAAVQLERLDELERAVAALDPDQFVRKTDPGVGRSAAPGETPSLPSSEHSFSSF